MGGNYKKMLSYALMERDEFVSNVIDEACDGFGTQEKVLIDVSLSLTFFFFRLKRGSEINSTFGGADEQMSDDTTLIVTP